MLLGIRLRFAAGEDLSVQRKATARVQIFSGIFLQFLSDFLSNFVGPAWLAGCLLAGWLAGSLACVLASLLWPPCGPEKQNEKTKKEKN